MPPSHSLVAFAAAAFALIVVPGPSVLFVVGRGVAYGRRAAVTTVAGNAAGVYVQVIAVAIGLGAIVERSSAVFTTIKLAGAAYLVFLGLRTIRRPGGGEPSVDPTDRDGGVLQHLRDGFVVGIANPKAIVFFAAILPQFVEPDGAAAGAQMAVLGLVFVAIALISDSMWGLLAGTARQWFRGSPHRLRRLTTLGGLVMIGLGGRLALDSSD